MVACVSASALPTHTRTIFVTARYVERPRAAASQSVWELIIRRSRLKARSTSPFTVLMCWTRKQRKLKEARPSAVSAASAAQLCGLGTRAGRSFRRLLIDYRRSRGGCTVPAQSRPQTTGVPLRRRTLTCWSPHAGDHESRGVYYRAGGVAGELPTAPSAMRTHFAACISNNQKTGGRQ